MGSGLNDRSIEICLSRKRLRQFQGREDVRCYSHKTEGWCVMADDKFYTEDGRVFKMQAFRDLAKELFEKPDKYDVEEVIYLAVIKKRGSLNQLQDARDQIRGFQKRELEWFDPDFLLACELGGSL